MKNCLFLRHKTFFIFMPLRVGEMLCKMRNKMAETKIFEIENSKEERRNFSSTALCVFDSGEEILSQSPSLHLSFSLLLLLFSFGPRTHNCNFSSTSFFPPPSSGMSFVCTCVCVCVEVGTRKNGKRRR